MPDMSIESVVVPFEATSDNMPGVTSYDCNALFGVDNAVISPPARMAPACVIAPSVVRVNRSQALPSTVPPITESTSATARTRVSELTLHGHHSVGLIAAQQHPAQQHYEEQREGMRRTAADVAYRLREY